MSSTTKTSTSKFVKKQTKVTPKVEVNIEKEVTVEPTETVTATATETETVATTGTTETTVDYKLMEQFEELLKSKQMQVDTLRREMTGLRKMMKDYQAQVRELTKKGKKKRSTTVDGKPRKPSGFAEPIVVSDDLYKFLSKYGVEKGTPIARTEVTKYIIAYIKEKNLQNPERRREIVPDATLSKLFGPSVEHRDPTDTNSPMVYSYLKLQKYLTSHFPKKQKA